MSEPFNAPLQREHERETNRMNDYKKTYTLHNNTVFDSGRALLVEVVPNGNPIQITEHEIARNNIVDELVRHFFCLPANGRFKHVYFNTTNPVEEPPSVPAPPVDVDDFLMDENGGGAGHATQVDAMIGAILKLFHKNEVKYDEPNDIDQKLKKAYDDSKDDAPDGPFNDLLCDRSMSIRYYYDKLKKMFVSGGFFLAICDCNNADERKTMRIRVSMLVTYEAPCAGGAGGGVPEKLDDIVRDIRARADAHLERRNTKKYVTQRTLPAFGLYPHARGRLMLEALCVYSIPSYKPLANGAPDLSGRSMNVFDFILPSDSTKIVQVLSGQVCLQFLDVYACLHGIPEIKLESVLRSFGKSSVQGNEYIFAPETSEQMPDLFKEGDWVHYRLSTADWHSGVVDKLFPERAQMDVRRWDPKTGDFDKDPDNVPMYFIDEHKRFLADIRPGQNVFFRVGVSRRNPFKPGTVIHLAPGNNEWILANTDGREEKVPYYVRKYRGTSTPRLSFLHEYYYQFGYDFEESETIYSLLTLRPIVQYHAEAWYDPKNVDANKPLYGGGPARQNLDPDHKELRALSLRQRQHTRSEIYPVQDGSKLPVPIAYVHPLENREPKDKVDTTLTRMNSYLIPMVRRVTGVYKPRGEVINKISLPDLDGKFQPDWRHLQSTVLQAVAHDNSDRINRESWQFRFGVFNDPAAIIGPVPLGITAGSLYKQGGKQGWITGLSAKKAERIRAALAVGTAQLQYALVARQKRDILNRSLGTLVRKKRALRELLQKQSEPPEPPVLSPGRAKEVVRTSSVKSSELERAVSVTLPSSISSTSSTSTTAPTHGQSMSLNQFMQITGSKEQRGAGSGGHIVEASTPRRDLIRDRNLPEELGKILADIRKVASLSNLSTLADYDEMRRRAMSMLQESDVDEATKEEIIQSFHLRVPEQTAFVLLTPRKTTPVLVHTHQGELVALGNTGKVDTQEQQQQQQQEAAAAPSSRKQTRLIAFNQKEHGMTESRVPVQNQTKKGTLLEDVRSLCDSLYVRLQNIQGDYAGKSEKWFTKAANEFIKMAKEYFKVLNPILSKLPNGTRTFAIQVFEDVETIAIHTGSKIQTMSRLKELVQILMNKILTMDDHVVISFVDQDEQVDDEEAWMYQRHPTPATRRTRVVHDSDDEEEEEKDEEEQLAEEIFHDAPNPAPPLPPVLPPIQKVIEIDDDQPPTQFEYDSDIELIHDTKTRFGKKHKHLQSVRGRTRLAR